MKKVLSQAISGLLIGAPLVAVSSVYAADEEASQTIVVTATRTAQTVDETLAPVTVFTREDIDRTQSSGLFQLLSRVPGIQMVRSGGKGSNVSLYLRGTDTGHALLLVDGVRQSSATLGQTSFEDIDLELVERVEVVRGARSSLYGADAIGGVIQVFTKKGSKKKNAYVKAGLGTDNTRQSSAGFSGSIDKTSYSLNLSHYTTDGIDATEDHSFNNVDHDGYRISSVGASLSQEFANNITLDLNYSRSEGKSEFDRNRDFSDFDRESESAKLTVPVSDTWTTSLQLSHFIDESQREGSYRSQFDTERDGVVWQNDVFMTDSNLLTVGVDYYDDQVSSDSSFDETDRDNLAYFVQDQFSISEHDFLVAVRHDDNQGYGHHNTYDASWGTNLTDNVRSVLTLGKSFKAPSFNDLYYPLDPWGYQGNASLRPEKAKSYDLGLSGNFNGVKWTTNFYRIDIKDLIEWGFSPENVNDARINGFEGSLSKNVNGWDVNTSLTILDPRNRDTGKELNRRSKRTLNVDIYRDFGQYDLGLTLLAQSQRYQDLFGGGQQHFSGYAIVNMRAGYEINKEVRVSLQVNNLFDADYATQQLSAGNNYEVEGTSALFTVAYTPEIK